MPFGRVWIGDVKGEVVTKLQRRLVDRFLAELRIFVNCVRIVIYE